MFAHFLLSLIALALLIIGADMFVDASAGAARRLKISEFMIGTTLVALGTSLPELTVSVLASLTQNTGLVIGNIVGSNIANIGLVLAMGAALTKGLSLDGKTFISRDIPFIILGGLVLTVLSFDRVFQHHEVQYNGLTLGDGIILLIFLIIFLYYIFGSLKTGEVLQENIQAREKEFKNFSWRLLLSRFIGGLVLIIFGGRLLVNESVAIATLLGLSETTLGLTLIALGTSFPEAVTSLIAIKKGKESIAIGNIVGSNTINIFLILGVSAILGPIEFPIHNLVHLLVMLAFSAALFLSAYLRKRLTRPVGISMVVGYLVYIVLAVAKDMG